MQLDFTAIVGNLALHTPTSSLEAPRSPFKDIDIEIITEEDTEPNKGKKISNIGQNTANLLTQYQREQREFDRAREVYRDYQDNIKVSEILRGEILKGVNTGQPIEPLFLKACEIVSKMTGDRSFYSQIEETLIAIYGEGMQATAPLQLKLDAIYKRLDNMEQAIKREGLSSTDKNRIQRAIDSHKQEAYRIDNMIKKAAG